MEYGCPSAMATEKLALRMGSVRGGSPKPDCQPKIGPKGGYRQRDVAGAVHLCGLYRIERPMRVQTLRARPRRRARPVDAGKRDLNALAPNVLNRQFTASAPNQK